MFFFIKVQFAKLVGWNAYFVESPDQRVCSVVESHPQGQRGSSVVLARVCSMVNHTCSTDKVYSKGNSILSSPIDAAHGDWYCMFAHECFG